MARNVHNRGKSLFPATGRRSRRGPSYGHLRRGPRRTRSARL